MFEPIRQARKVLPQGSAALAVLCLGAALTAFSVSKVREIELAEAEVGIERQLAAAAEEINRRLQRLAVAVIGGSGLPDTQGEVSQETWRRFVAPFRLPYVLDGVIGLGYAKIERAADGELRAVVRAVETGAARMPPLKGLNLYDHIGVGEVINSAITVRGPALSARLKLPDEEREVVLLVAPVYSGDMAPEGKLERRREAAGVVFAVVPLADLFRSMPNWIETEAVFDVFDGPLMERSEETPIHHSHGPHFPALADQDHRHNVEVSFGGRIWRVQMREIAGQANVENRDRSTLTLIAGSLATLLLTWMVSHQGLLRRRAEARALEMTATLRASQEKLNLITDHVDCGIIVVQNGSFTYLNPGALALTGRTLEEAIGHPFFPMVYPDDQQMVLDRHLRRSRGEDVEKTYDFRVVRKDGTVVWVEISAVQIMWDDHPATLSFLNDISWRKNLEGALRRKSAEQDAILQNSQVGICYTLDRRCEWFNKAFARMLGYAPEELQGASTRLFHAEDKSWQRVTRDGAAAFARGEVYVGEMPLRRKDGTAIWVHLSGSALHLEHAGQAAGAIWTVVDITARRQAEDDIRRALDQQRELNELKSRFVAMTSHEFRTPLATILSSTELIRYYGDRLPSEEKANLLDSIEAGVRRMTRMLDDILILGRAEAGMVTLRPQAQEAEALVREIALEAAQAAGDAASARLAIPPALPGVRLMLDTTQVRHIVGNLVGNAFKYSPTGGSVRVALCREGDWLRLEVADQGIGIPLEDQPRLYASFHRASNVSNISGTGLGLAIVKRAVELHGGLIEVDSAPGRGTRFVVRLPWVEVPASIEEETK